MIYFRTLAFACSLVGASGAQVSLVSAEPVTTPVAATQSVIPPIVLQGCAEKVKAHHGRIYANRHILTGSETGDQVVGFDLSFVNTTTQTAKIVVVRVGDTAFTKIGSFAPDAVIAWRIAARPGSCEVTAVRFADGSEWSSSAPAAAFTQSIAPSDAASPSP